MSVGKWTNQNFCKNCQVINSFLLNVPELLDDRSSVGTAARCHILLAGNI